MEMETTYAVFPGKTLPPAKLAIFDGICYDTGENAAFRTAAQDFPRIIAPRASMLGTSDRAAPENAHAR